MLSSPYKSGDRIKVFYGKGKNLCLYEAKIIGTEEGENGRDYLVHYNGWNTRYDEWISESRIAEKVTGPSKAIRPQYSKVSVHVHVNGLAQQVPVCVHVHVQVDTMYNYSR